jgi:hypothetical protein
MKLQAFFAADYGHVSCDVVLTCMMLRTLRVHVSPPSSSKKSVHGILEGNSLPVVNILHRL